jgi:hypothetical protein
MPSHDSANASRHDDSRDGNRKGKAVSNELVVVRHHRTREESRHRAGDERQPRANPRTPLGVGSRCRLHGSSRYHLNEFA